MESQHQNALTSLVYWRDWQKCDQALKLFPSEESLYWFIRSNKQHLIDAGAVVILRQRLHINPNEFERVGFEVLHAASKRLFAGNSHD